MHHDKYKCIIHSRDWTPGAAIPDQILESVENSRRTVIVLSEDYVSSMWSNMEFRTAHSKALKENIQVVRSPEVEMGEIFFIKYF